MNAVLEHLTLHYPTYLWFAWISFLGWFVVKRPVKKKNTVKSKDDDSDLPPPNGAAPVIGFNMLPTGATA